MESYKMKLLKNESLIIGYPESLQQMKKRHKANRLLVKNNKAHLQKAAPFYRYIAIKNG